jgi:hypothetical protein
VGVALLVGDGEAVGGGLALGVEDALEPAAVAPVAGTAARLIDAGAAQLAAPNPVTMTSRQTTSQPPDRRFR